MLENEPLGVIDLLSIERFMLLNSKSLEKQNLSIERKKTSMTPYVAHFLASIFPMGGTVI